MPDRFDLMNQDDLHAALRISSDYCNLVNQSRLHEGDITRIERGGRWLTSMHHELAGWVDNRAPTDHKVFERPPTAEGPIGVKTALASFREANEKLRDLFRSHLASHWDTTQPYGATGSHVSFADLARHVARVSQTTSVDQRWVWD